MKLGVVVVTHGQLATELVNAAEMIVGDLPHFAAVSIGWHDDVDHAREEIGQAIERVQASAGGTESEPADVLVLTDMFGGTPANLGVTFVGPHVEVITGVNLPMLIKLARPPQDIGPPDARARDARARPQRHLGRVGSAARREGDDDVRTLTVIERRSGCTRAPRPGSSTPPARFASQIRVARGGREMDGKSIMGLLLLAAAQGSAITHHGGRRRTSRGRREALCALVERGFDEAPCA